MTNDAKNISCQYGHLNNELLQNTWTVTDMWWAQGPRTQCLATDSVLMSHVKGAFKKKGLLHGINSR